MIKRKRFIIDGLTRTGSTTLARLLNLHPEIDCLMEPFHPRRYGGQFNRMAIEAQSVEQATNLIWQRWSGFKHVWEANGWPFTQDPWLNERVVLCADRVIFLQRRNLLRRAISSIISAQLRFWVGTANQFRTRLEAVQLQELDPLIIREAVGRDQAAVRSRCQLLSDSGHAVLRVAYEELYSDEVTPYEQWQRINTILEFVGVSAVSQSTFREEWSPLLSRDVYRWASADVYRLMPGIQQIERQVGCDETGWLFR